MSIRLTPRAEGALNLRTDVPGSAHGLAAQVREGEALRIRSGPVIRRTHPVSRNVLCLCKAGWHEGV